MHIVYNIIFDNRRASNTIPYQYIGSKTNCSLVENRILDKHGRVYSSSSKDKMFKKLIDLGESYIVEILEEFDGDEKYERVLLKEREIQTQLDVVANVTFFNKGIAAYNNFSDPAYATMKHLESGKIARIPRNHPDVLNGLWVGTTKGTKLTEEQRKRIGRSGVLNNNFGRKWSEDIKMRMSEGSKKFFKTERGKELREEISIRAKKTFRNLVRTAEHNRKIGEASKGRIVLINKNTRETVCVPVSDRIKFDRDIWVLPFHIGKENL